MELFKYETHSHTSEVSKCSRITAIELVQVYKELGFDGVCITDHFINGNTTVPKNLTWAERMELFCTGYENAYAEGKRLDIKVFFGWEYSYKGTDFLTYGLDKEWLLKHPELADITTINEYCDFIHANGGFIIHAHPFREANYIDMIRLAPRKVDGIEVINSCRTDFENKCADIYADSYNLLKIAGTDNHEGYRDKLSGIQLTRKLKNIDDMVMAIKNGETNMFEMEL